MTETKPSIKIVHRYDPERVLYVAENASDTRDAVEQAVKEKANLRGADLRSADLRCADLRMANLSDANLSDADLSWADLSGANLSGANLPWWLQAIYDAGRAEERGA